MEDNFLNQNNSSLLTNEIDYSKVEGTFPATYNDASSYNPYPSTTYNTNELNNFNIPSNNNYSSPGYLTQTLEDSSKIYEEVNNTDNEKFATVVRLYDEESQKVEGYQNVASELPTDNIEYNINNNDNYVDSNNVIETDGYQTSYQQNEFTDNIINDNINEYQAISPINYNTTSNSLPYDYNINSAPAEYSTNTNEVTNDYNNDYNNNYYETSNETNNNYYSTNSAYVPEMINSDSNNNYSNYNTNSVPVDITPQFNEDDDTEIIPVEEVEYIPVKRTKYIKTKKVKVVPEKKTVVIPKKVYVPIPVKKTVYIQKEQKPKVIPSLTKVTKIPTVINQQQNPTIPARKNVLYNTFVHTYKPKVYRIKL